MSTGYDRRSPKQNAFAWVLIALAVVVAAVIFMHAL